MRNLNFHTAYTYLQANYGLYLDILDFEQSGMIAYERIGNKATTLDGFLGDVVNGELSLPCEAERIEAVFASFPDFQKTSNKERYPGIASSFVERYIEYWKFNKSLLYDYGTLLTYTIEGNTLRFDKDYKNVLVLYKHPITDPEGFPYINSKEADAIAAYCAYTHFYKQALATKDGNVYQMAKNIEQEWGRLCSRARTPEKLSQNDLDRMLNVYTSFDRKTYGKSFKPEK